MKNANSPASHISFYWRVVYQELGMNPFRLGSRSLKTVIVKSCGGGGGGQLHPWVTKKHQQPWSS